MGLKAKVCQNVALLCGIHSETLKKNRDCDDGYFGKLTHATEENALGFLSLKLN